MEILSNSLQRFLPKFSSWAETFANYLLTVLVSLQ